MMKRSTFLKSIPALLFLPPALRVEPLLAQSNPPDQNETICREKFELALALDLGKKPIGEIVIEMARSFIGTPYAANPIEDEGPEHLVVNLKYLDCVTLFENSLVLARCIRKGNLNFVDFKKELKYIRYRNGIIDGYPSRLHYTTDYFYDNERKGVLTDVTKAIGGFPYKKKIDFMSVNADKYAKLKENPGFVAAIRKIEDTMNSRSISYIPKGKVKETAPEIMDGDILGITTSIEGLDCSHTGIAVHSKNGLRLLHAPSPGEKVQISKLTLREYLDSIKKDTGIIVARPKEP
jgi:hypothetical protein